MEPDASWSNSWVGSRLRQQAGSYASTPSTTSATGIVVSHVRGAEVKVKLTARNPHVLGQHELN